MLTCAGCKLRLPSITLFRRIKAKCESEAAEFDLREAMDRHNRGDHGRRLPRAPHGEALVVDHIEQRSCSIRKRGGVTLARAKILNYAPRRMTG